MNASWFLEERGIRQDTLDHFGVKFVGDEVIFPYPTGEKARYWDEEGKRRFRFTKGMRMAFYGPEPEGEALFLCEGETDTMRLWQELQEEDSKAGVLGIGGVDTWNKISETDRKKLEKYKSIYLLLDNDQDYNTVLQVDRVAMDIRKTYGLHKVKRIRLPENIKDTCEFFDAGYNVESLRLLGAKGKSISRFKPLDLNSEPPPVHWLLDGLVAKGDLTLFSGPSGIGKSWFTMGFAQAVADGTEEFLGRTVFEGGKVLIFDEENPVDVIFERLNRLGLGHKSNIRYIWNNSVRIDRNADMILEEALDFQPVLIILDSLTRIHTQDENTAGQMAPLMNNCIKPLARDTGAAVVLIHHHDKANMGPRGSGDIFASVDAVIEGMGDPGSGFFNVTVKKSRRKLGGNGFGVRITDNSDGSASLKASDIDIDF